MIVKEGSNKKIRKAPSAHTSTAGYRRSIIWGIAVFYALSFALSAYIGWKSASRELNESLTNRLIEAATAKAQSIDLYIERIKSISRSYARAIERTVPAGEKISPAMLNAFRSEAGVAALYFGDANGGFVSDLSWNDPANYDPRTRPWYQAAVENLEEPVYSGIYHDMVTGQLAISFSTPVRERNGSLRGVLGTDILLSTLSAELGMQNTHFPGYAFLVDHDGSFLVNPADSVLGKKLIDMPGARDLSGRIMDGSLSLIEYHDRKGRMALTARLPHTGWVVGLVTEKKLALAPLYQLGWIFAILFTISLLLVVLSSALIATRLTAFAKRLEVELGLTNVELQAKIREIEKMSITDALTGIANRRRLDQQLSVELQRARRTKKPFSVIMFDIDHFKNINDEYGHNQGDIALKELSALVGANIRDIDILGRWGGEEFLILCPTTNREGARKLAEKIRKEIEITFAKSAPPITCSFGCAVSHRDETPTHLICRADTAMYLAKNSGRNRVMINED